MKHTYTYIEDNIEKENLIFIKLTFIINYVYLQSISMNIKLQNNLASNYNFILLYFSSL